VAVYCASDVIHITTAAVLPCTFQTAGRKRQMEDRHVLAALHPQQGVCDAAGAITPQHAVSLAAVFDGHAGEATAAFAAKHIPRLLHNALSGQHGGAGSEGEGVGWPHSQPSLNMQGLVSRCSTHTQESVKTMCNVCSAAVVLQQLVSHQLTDKDGCLACVSPCQQRPVLLLPCCLR